MSGMNFLERLLDGGAVEWKPLGEVAKIQRGRRLVKSELEEVGKYAVFQNCMTPLGYYHESNAKSDTTFIISAGAAGEIGYSDVDFWAADDVYYFLTPENLKSKFLYYFLLTQQTKILGQVRRASVPRLSKTAFEKIPLPIPCPDNPDRSLAIQAEIVRILDTFTALTAELTAEISDRKKQYNYYRDRLLTFGDEVPVMQLSQCCVSIADGDHQAPPQTNIGIPFITISNVSNSYQIDFTNTKFVSEAYYSELDDKRKARKNDILYTVVGSFGIPVFIDDNRKFTFQRHIAILRPNGNVILPKYLYHVLRSSDFLKQAYAVAVGAAQKTITLTALNRMKVPVPSLEEQARIIAILDKFDTLTHSISEGLPREIALRQKQYEYYRDLLLSFPPPLTLP
ncbi:MAG: restriction endonuclease subunit S [Pseudanabaena sp.]